jgi:hypothetical protein
MLGRWDKPNIRLEEVSCCNAEGQFLVSDGGCGVIKDLADILFLQPWVIA